MDSRTGAMWDLELSSEYYKKSDDVRAVWSEPGIIMLPGGGRYEQSVSYQRGNPLRSCTALAARASLIVLAKILLAKILLAKILLAKILLANSNSLPRNGNLILAVGFNPLSLPKLV